MTAIDEQALKKQFAEAWILLDDPMKAAFALFPDQKDTGKALQIGTLWQQDHFVKLERERLKGSGGVPLTVSKEQQARDVYKIAEDEKNAVEDRLKAHRLYAEICGHIEKDKAGNVTLINQPVMLIKDKGDNEEWEQKAIEHQRKLTSGTVIDAPN